MSVAALGCSLGVVGALVPMIVPVAPASAQVAKAMDDFVREAGGAANVTGPSAFQGQSAG